MARPLSARAGVGLAALTLVVLAVHGCVGSHIAAGLADASAEAAMPARMQVSFVRQMESSAPSLTAVARPAAPAAPAVAHASRPHAVQPVSDAASAPEMLPAKSALPATITAAVPEPLPAAAPPEPTAQTLVVEAAPTLAKSEVEAASAAASAPVAVAVPDGPAFEWPVSTRLSYLLTGNYRGEIHGSAQVEWLRVGDAYQVHLDITVGLSFAPLLSRRMSSQGRLGPEGLLPLRYDEDSKVAFRDRRRLTMGFEPDTIVMANGDRQPRAAGVQDTASQFVQLAYLFGTQPGLLTPGGTIELPLALPRRVSRWTYDVLSTEVLHTPFGALDAVHLTPRLGSAGNGDLTAEIWFAPSLRYLPVRIRIRQDAETFIDLMIERKPELAAG